MGDPGDRNVCSVEGQQREPVVMIQVPVLCRQRDSMTEPPGGEDPGRDSVQVVQMNKVTCV